MRLFLSLVCYVLPPPPFSSKGTFLDPPSSAAHRVQSPRTHIKLYVACSPPCTRESEGEEDGAKGAKGSVSQLFT